MCLTGWTPEQIASTPAVYLDHLLACDRAAGKAAERRAEEERDRMKANR